MFDVCSRALSKRAQASCDGQYQCKIPVLAIEALNAEMQEQQGLDAEEIAVSFFCYFLVEDLSSH